MRAFLPSIADPDKHIWLLRCGLVANGVDVGELPIPITSDWLLRNQEENAILHHHWPSYHYTMNDRELTAKLVDQWIATLSHSISLGYTHVWTAHNLWPHDAPHKELQQLARTALVRSCSALIAHCQFAAKSVRQFGDTPVTVVPHGNYIDSYGAPVPKLAARRALGLKTHSFVYLSFGKMRRYKGLEQLIDVFRNDSESSCELLLAGLPESESYREQLYNLAKKDSRIHFHARLIEDDKLPVYFGAADVVVLTHKAVLTSGPAVLAQSMGKAVVAPALGCLPEMIPPKTGILYAAESADSLSKAMKEIRTLDLVAAGNRALAYVSRQSWHEIAKETQRVYAKAIQDRRSNEAEVATRMPAALESLLGAIETPDIHGRLIAMLANAREHPSLVADNDFRLARLVAHGPHGGEWIIDLGSAAIVRTRKEDDVGCTISTQSSTLARVLDRKLNARFAFLSGDLAVDGRLVSAQKLFGLLGCDVSP